ncbi:MAG: DASH family cryptochrome [Saprospiraceae bacterium]|nr:DASH family cryptochrome [Saprospiraceae bacterium]
MRRRSIVWFRSDLRLHDNQALIEAVRASDEILCLYVFDPRVFQAKTRFGFAKTGKHRARFILESVQALRHSLQEHGADLIVRIGLPENVIFEFANTLKTSWVFCNRERTRDEIMVQDALERNLWSIGQEMRYERGKMLLYTQDLPFPVTHAPDSFAAFKKEVEHFVEIRNPLPVPKICQIRHDIIPGDIPTLSDFNHETDISRYAWEFVGGESEGMRKLGEIAATNGQDHYPSSLDSSRSLSPWISHGCLSPKSIYAALVGHGFLNASNNVIASLLWRDHLRLMGKKYKNRIFQKGGPLGSPKKDDINDLESARPWLQGQTGIDIIDACMSQLTRTGYLAHRGRILVASYLVNDLNVNWQIGAEFFESLLLDYDPCSNYGNWNYIAGVGPDGYKERQLNIDNQQQKLDPDGTYVQRWLPKVMEA